MSKDPRGYARGEHDAKGCKAKGFLLICLDSRLIAEVNTHMKMLSIIYFIQRPCLLRTPCSAPHPLRRRSASSSNLHLSCFVTVAKRARPNPFTGFVSLRLPEEKPSHDRSFSGRSPTTSSGSRTTRLSPCGSSLPPTRHRHLYPTSASCGPLSICHALSRN